MHIDDQSQEPFWSLMCLCSIITIIAFDILPLIYESQDKKSHTMDLASLISGYLGLPAGCALHLLKPAFNLQVLKFIVIHGYNSSISPDPFHSQRVFIINKPFLCPI